MKINKNQILVILYVLASTLLLLWPAIFNGYPLVTEDSGNYIQMSGTLKPLSFRPIGYAFFIRVFGLNGWSLWPVIIVQSIFANSIFLIVFKMLFSKKHFILLHLIALSIASFFTGFAWYASQVMTDIFVVVLFFMLFIVFFKKNLRIWQYLLLGLSFCWLAMMHYSMLIFLWGSLFIALVVFLIRFKNLKGSRFHYRLITLFSALVVSMVAATTYTASFDSPTEYGSGKYVFMMGRICESGILEKYLNENCQYYDFSICEYKDQLPDLALEFVWGSKSPFRMAGIGFLEADREYKLIFKDIVTTPKYLFELVFVDGFRQTITQMYTMKIGFGLYSHSKEQGFFKALVRTFPSEEDNYLASREYTKRLNFGYWNTVNPIILILSLIIIVWILSIYKVDYLVRVLSAISFSGYVLNAAIVSNMANVSWRLGGRAAYVFVFLAVILLTSLLTNKYEKRFLIKK